MITAVKEPNQIDSKFYSSSLLAPQTQVLIPQPEPDRINLRPFVFLNTSGEVMFYHKQNGFGAYLPQERDGLPSGFSWIDRERGLGLSDSRYFFNDTGDIVFEENVQQETRIWREGLFFDVLPKDENLVTDEPFTLNDGLVTVLDINDNGDILGIGRLDSGDNWLVLFHSGEPEKVIYELSASKTEVEVDEIFTVDVKVTNLSEERLTSVFLGEGGIRPAGNAPSEFAGEIPEAVALEQGEEAVISFPIKGTAKGHLTFTAKAAWTRPDTTRIQSVDRTTEKVTILGPPGDLLIKKTDDPEADFAINDTYQTAPVGQQRKTEFIRSNETTSYQVKIENDHDEAVSYFIKASETSVEGWTTTYQYDGNDITAQILSQAGWETPELEASASILMTVEIVPPEQPVEDESERLIILLNEATDLTARDSVSIIVTSRDVIIVNDNRDLPDHDPDDGILDADPDMDGDQVTLRAAVDFANEREGADAIHFDIEGGGTPKIVLENRELDPVGQGSTFLDGGVTITETVIIDGTTQPGSGMVEITRTTEEFFASWEGDSLIGLEHNSSVLRGLVINGNAGFGIRLGGQGQHVVEGCYIGTDVTGSQARGNGFSTGNLEGSGGGILVVSPFNRIGGTSSTQGNLISGNGPFDFDFDGRFSPSATPGILIIGVQSIGNVVIGNTIGLDISGNGILSPAISNTGSRILEGQAEAIRISRGSNANGPSNNRIGGSLAGERNYMASGSGPVIRIEENISGTQILGNFIGTNRQGTQIVGGTSAGVKIMGNLETKIGGFEPGSGNLIPQGIQISDSSFVDIFGNMIGVASDGVSPLISGGWGIENESSTSEITGNVIANKPSGGLIIFGDYQSLGVRVLDNQFLNNNPNGSGGGIPSPAIWILDGSRHEISKNLFSGNSGPAIDLDPFDWTPNDPGDEDNGPNGLINYPDITSAISLGDTIEVEGELDVDVIGSVLLEFYSSRSYSPYSGRSYPQAESFVDQIQLLPPSDNILQVTLDDESFLLGSGQIPQAGEYLTAITNSPNLGTSELSSAELIQGSTQTDSDTISDEVEDQAPNRNPPTEPLILRKGSQEIYTTNLFNAVEGFGDGNGDGVLDSEQNHVASFPAISGGFITLEAVDSGAQLMNVNPTDLPAFQDIPRFEFTHGFTEFVVGGFSGESATVDLFFTEIAGINSFWLFGPSEAGGESDWFEFLFDGSTGAEILEDRVRLHLADGQIGDADLEVNGSISIAGGPGIAFPLPHPNIQALDSNPTVKLSWPINTGALNIEESEDLEHWTTLSADIEVIDGKDAILTQPTEVPSFYRLTRE